MKEAGLTLGAISMGSSFIMSCGTGSPATSVVADAVVVANTDFEISLAQWYLHKAFFAKELDPANFPRIAKEQFGINCIELVNQFYRDVVNDQEYWLAFKNQCDELDVQVGLIMCDGLGHLGDADEMARAQTVQNHHTWVDIAKYLGAHSIRVNAAGAGSSEEVSAHAIAGLTELTAYGASKEINIIVENHGGYYSNGKWLANVIQSVDSTYCGTLPDFGNFCIERAENGRDCLEAYDRYMGIEELMSFAKGVSAKANEFDAEGNDTQSDFLKIMTIVKKAGFKGHVGIEYEGETLSEPEGIVATKKLLEKTFLAL